MCSIGQIQLWGGDKGVNRNGGNLQYFEIHTRHKDLTIILADELPKSAEAMFTGGEVIYTFGTNYLFDANKIGCVDRIGRYLIIQMEFSILCDVFESQRS